MNIKFHKGFSVYESGEDPVFVTPHSGPAFEVTTSRDDYSETSSYSVLQECLYGL